MIVWLASFPRSGNTFLRIVLDRLYGARSSVIYDVDGVALRLGLALIGYQERPASLGQMRASSAVYFVKTHRQRDADVDESDGAICLVRDGRDSLVSWARMASEDDPSQFAVHLCEMIERSAKAGTGSWGANVLSWLQPPAAHRITLRYENLIADPTDVVTSAMSRLAPELRSIEGGTVPSFADLRHADQRFFRRGLVGSHRDELPDDLHRLFWSRLDNRAAMSLLGVNEVRF